MVDVIYEEAIKGGVIIEGREGKVSATKDDSEMHDLSPMDDRQPNVDAMRKRTVKARDIGGRRMKLRRGITMDTGASANVMPRRMVRVPSQIRSSPGSRAGVKYVAANDGVIYNEGEYDFTFQTKEGHEEVVTMQIAQVNKALGSVAYFVDRGCQVIFDQDEITKEDLSRMVHKASGRVSTFRRERNI